MFCANCEERFDSLANGLCDRCTQKVARSNLMSVTFVESIPKVSVTSEPDYNQIAIWVRAYDRKSYRYKKQNKPIGSLCDYIRSKLDLQRG